jgi:hypothetical protein
MADSRASKFPCALTPCGCHQQDEHWSNKKSPETRLSEKKAKELAGELKKQHKGNDS